MLFTAADEHHVDLGSSWMIGDSKKDVEAGISAGCRTARILATHLDTDDKADVLAQSLLGAVLEILRLEHTSVERSRVDAMQSNR
jgi:D-glycero-D-manno-heptose 1,7-bisphosphate phosphatase